MAGDGEEAPSEHRPRENTALLLDAGAPVAWSDMSSWKRRLFLLQRGPREYTPLLPGAGAPAAWSDMSSWKRHVFLFLTEPESSRAATVYFFCLMLAIAASNVIFIMQTMASWQMIPTDCFTCGGDVSYVFEDDEIVIEAPGCTCPPAPLRILEDMSDYLIVFFTVEWLLRAVAFTPAASASAGSTRIRDYARQWLAYLTSGPMVLDFLAIFPYYLEDTNLNQLVSLRLLRLFRTFGLLRLGKYSGMVRTLTNVLKKSVTALKILILVLVFGGALFGSIVYNFERGVWKYWAPTDDYQYIRMTQNGVTEEISPFSSIPKSLWWFVVTATTVGYGDFYPTSTIGQFCGAAAMLTGVLVIAFPVGIFSDLWQQEVKANHKDKEGIHHGSSSQGEEGASATARGSGGSAGGGAVRMEREDLRAIAQCMQTIRDRQDTLSSILHKYEHNVENSLV